MPHECIRCSKAYADDAKEIVKGCSCGSKLFFYIKGKKTLPKLSEEQKELVEEEIADITGKDVDDDGVSVIDLEGIEETAPGKYAIDVGGLLSGEKIVRTAGEGKFSINLTRLFKGK